MPDNSQPLLFASANPGKCREVKEIAKSFPNITILAPGDINSDTSKLGAVPEVDENANSYHGNALLKAEAFYKWCGLPSFSDDSGLEVDALEGGPGIFSARYAGEKADAAMNIQKLLFELKNTTNRKARFYCLVCLVGVEDKPIVVDASLNGDIIDQARGDGGFGYDSVFVPQGYDQTLAELKGSGVEVRTHRVMAVRKLMGELL